MLESLFNKFGRLSPAFLLKRYSNSHFPVKFAKSLTTPNLKIICKEEEEEEEIYFSKQKHSVQPVVCLNTVISNNKKYYITVLKNMYFKYSDIVKDFI